MNGARSIYLALLLLCSNARADTSVTFTSTADFTNNAVVGPDLTTGTVDDSTNGPATEIESELVTLSDQAKLVGSPQDDFRVVAAGHAHVLAIK